MTESMFVLGVDLDGVCAAYEDALRTSIAKRRPADPESLPPQVTFDGYSGWGLDPISFEQAHRTAVRHDRIFRTMRPVAGASEALWRLSDLGVWIRIITHRLMFNGLHDVTAADTAWWLEHHEIPYRDLCFIGAKADVGADLYVDDSPSIIAMLRAAGRDTIVFDRPYNRHLAGPRAQSWPQVVAIVEGILGARE